ncbi:MAG: hypothetical protein QXK24_01260 [Ignisphaera sp.]
MQTPENELRQKIAPYEKYIIINSIEKFIECVSEATGWNWKPLDITFIGGEKIARLIAIHRKGDKVYSIIAYYDPEKGEDIGDIPYEGFDVDISSIDEVEEVIGNV